MSHGSTLTEINRRATGPTRRKNRLCQRESFIPQGLAVIEWCGVLRHRIISNSSNVKQCNDPNPNEAKNAQDWGKVGDGDIAGNWILTFGDHMLLARWSFVPRRGERRLAKSENGRTRGENLQGSKMWNSTVLSGKDINSKGRRGGEGLIPKRPKFGICMCQRYHISKKTHPIRMDLMNPTIAKRCMLQLRPTVDCLSSNQPDYGI